MTKQYFFDTIKRKVEKGGSDMLILNGAFYNDSEIDTPIYTEPLFVTSAGHHTIISQKEFQTIRPYGRRDYQILYVNKGKLFYYIDNVEYCCEENSILIYRPFEPQFYEYRLEDNSDICWIHFSGNNVDEILKQLDLLSKNSYTLQTPQFYSKQFDKIIFELQQKQINFSRIANALFQEMLSLFSRDVFQSNSIQNKLSPEVSATIEHFNKHYSEHFNIAQFADSLNISTSWLSRKFKIQLGTSPHKYLNELRINKAKIMMRSNLSIREIAKNVGFDDQLYFSRIFRKHTGLSPSEYRKSQPSLRVSSVPLPEELDPPPNFTKIIQQTNL